MKAGIASLLQRAVRRSPKNLARRVHPGRWLDQLEDRRLLSVSIANGSLLEPDVGQTENMVFTVTLDAAEGTDVTVEYATAPGTATAGVDYTATTGTLTIPAGQTTGQILVPILGDHDIEADETFTVTLSNVTGTTEGDTLATGEIFNDDVPTATIADVTVTEGDAGTTDATITVTLSAAATSVVTIDYATAPGTAEAGTDYTTTTGTLTIPIGQTTGTVTVPIIGEAVEEGDEAFTVNFTNPVGANLPDGEVAVTIEANDGAAPTPTLSVGDVTVAEGDAGTTDAVFTVTLSAAAATDVTVEYATTAGTATAGDDYTTTTGTLTIPAGQTTGTITVPVVGDATDEDDEAFTLTLSNAANATIADGEATGTITDDDGPAQPTLSIGDVTVVEGNAGATNAVFTVTLSAAQATDVTVDYAVVGVSATAGEDFTAATGTVTIPAGQTTGTVAVAVSGDATAEPDETFTVVLSNATGAVITDGSATGTIQNDDAATLPTLSIADVTVAEGDAGTTDATFTVTLSAASATDVTVQYLAAPGTASQGADYTATAGTLTIPAGQTTGTITVPVVGDLLVETDETFTVALANATGATIADNSATGTITNDDELPPAITIGNVTVTEPDAGTADATFTVTLPVAGAAPVTLYYTTVNVDATAGTDYAPTVGSVVIPAGETTTTVTVPVFGDNLFEPNEDFLLVAMADPTGTQLISGSGVGTIANDDSPSGKEVKVFLVRDLPVELNNNGNLVRFGRINHRANVTETFRITNSGEDDLNIENLGASAGFKIVGNVPDTLAPGESATFRVRMLSGTAGKRLGTVRIVTDDPTNPMFDIPVNGIVSQPGQRAKSRLAVAAKSAAAAKPFATSQKIADSGPEVWA